MILLGLAFVISVGFAACKKKDTTTTTTTTTPPTYTNSFSYKKNGTTVNVTSVTKAVVSLGGINYIAIAGNASNATLNLWITKNTGTGTFPLEFVGSNYVAQFSTTSPMTMYNSVDNGTMVITKHDLSGKIIEGSFQGTLYDDVAFPTDSVMISNGIFKINY